MPSNVRLHLAVDQLAPMRIDPHAGLYWWLDALSSLPTTPACVTVTTTVQGEDDPPETGGAPLDALTWVVGADCFPGVAAPWLRPHDRYRLERWPDLTLVPYSVEHLHLTALLANGLLTVPELAELGGVPTASAQRLINAFTLMGVVAAEGGPLVPPAGPVPTLRAVSWQTDAGVPASVTRPASGHAGLLGRLLQRLGR